MEIWLCRVGRHGEYEKRFLDEGRIYLTWEGLRHDLSGLKDRKALAEVLREVYQDAPQGRIVQNTGQIWAFAKRMQPKDWIILPSKLKPSAIHVGEITGAYAFDGSAEDPFRHYREVKWLRTDSPSQREGMFSPKAEVRAQCLVTIRKAEDTRDHDVVAGVAHDPVGPGWHLFGHTFAGRLVQAGVPIAKVSARLGHSDIRTTMMYAHLAPGHGEDIGKA